MMKTVVIHTDGACSGNGRAISPGGWAAVLRYGNHVKELSGGEANTTNNRMELTACIQALEALKQTCRVQLYTDSAYIVNCFKQQWGKNWKKNGWRTVKGTPVENRDLWEKLFKLNDMHNIEWIKVKGHAGNPDNELCDTLAKKAIPHL